MSKAQFDAFFTKVMEDEALRNTLSKIVTGGDPQTIHREVAAIAKGAGFDVAPEDVAEARVAVKPTGKLSDADLERVAGGKGHHDCDKVCDSVCGEFLGSWVGRQ